MRAFCAAVSRVKGGSGGRDMMASSVDGSRNLSPESVESIGHHKSSDHLSGDQEIKSAFISVRIDFGIGWARPPLMKAAKIEDARLFAEPTSQ
jgi:hypothetical protein